jgi:hypothetical protein
VNHSTRYEVLKNDTKYIKCHEWFKNLVWESVIARKTKPFVALSGGQDTTNFGLYEEGLGMAGIKIRVCG